MDRLSRSAGCAFGLILLALCSAWPRGASGAVLRHAKSFVFPSTETLHDDLYAAGSVVDIQGTVDGDLVVAGQTITIGGTVTGDVFAAGRDITISGSVGGTVRATCSSITVDGPVGHDILAGCGTFVIGPHATVGRDVLVGAGTASFGGRIARDVRAGGGTATFSGSVGGTVYANAKDLRLTDGAVLEHDLYYTSKNALAKAPGATVRGRVEQRVPMGHEGRHHGRSPVIWWLRGLVGFSILGLLFFLLFTGAGPRSVEALGRSPWASLGVGLMLALGIPAAAAFLFFVGLILGGWWIAFGMLVFYLFALAVGYVVAATQVGRWILARAGRSATGIGWALVLGLTALRVVGLIPFLGHLVACTAALVGLGALALAWFRSRQSAVPAHATVGQPGAAPAI